MQSKHSPVLMVSLITLIMIAPALITFGFICHHYFHLLQVPSFPHPSTLDKLQTVSTVSNPFVSKSLCQSSGLGEHGTIEHITRFLHETARVIMMITMGLFLLIPVRQGYRLYRSTMLKQKVAELERLWQQSTQH